MYRRKHPNCEGFPEDATHIVKDIAILRNSTKLPGNNRSEFSLYNIQDVEITWSVLLFTVLRPV